MRPRHALVAAATAALLATPLFATPAHAAAPTHEAASRRDPNPPWAGGLPISRPDTSPHRLGFWCTAGLPARKGNRTYLLSAGHCGRPGETIATAWTNGYHRVIGAVTGTSRRHDVAAIRTVEPVTGRIWDGRHTRPLHGVADAHPGQRVCQLGSRSAKVCGVTVVAATRVGGTTTKGYGRVDRGEIAARGGDSGGFVTNPCGRAVGIVPAISPDGRWIGWTPTTTGLDNWGLHAVTTP